MDAGEQLSISSSKPDGEPFAVCMSCRSEFPLETTECPNCHVSLSVVRNCPGCGRILSAKHANCLYCGHVFVPPVSKGGPDTRAAARPYQRPLWRRIAAVAVSVGVFLAVFIGANLFTRYQQNMVSLPPKIASSYALRDATIYRDAIRSSAELGHLKPTDTVSIVGYRLAGQDLQWYQVDWEGQPAYTPAKDFAPPRIEKADGSKLLELAILQIRTPEVIALAREAVRNYRQKFPQSRDGDQLMWILAERTRELSSTRRSQELFHQARGDYEKLASGSGELGENARKRLRELQWPPPLSGHKEESVAPAIQIVNGSSSGSFQQNGANQISLMDQTELSIRVPLLAGIAEGAVLQGQVARSVRAGKEVAVRAGSVCDMRVVQVMHDRKSVLLQLTSLQVGNHRLVVNTPPVVTSISPSRQEVSFRIATPLLNPN